MTARRVDKQEKRKRILEHATALFTERGYKETTIDAVAERAGVAKGTIYQYFASKQDLFFGVFDAFTEQYFAEVREQVPEGGVSTGERLRRASEAAFRMAAQHQEVLPLTFEFWAASGSSSLEMRERFQTAFREMYAVFRGFFGEILREGIERGEFVPTADIEAITAVLVGSLDGLFLQAWFDETMDPVTAGDAFLDVFLRGLETGADAVKEASA